jgi:hypothetical protein
MNTTVSPRAGVGGKRGRPKPVDRVTRASELLAKRGLWRFRHDDEGVAYVEIPASDASGYWHTRRDDCSCPDRANRQAVCAHMLAVRFWLVGHKAGLIELPSEIAAARARKSADVVDDYDAYEREELARAHRRTGDDRDARRRADAEREADRYRPVWLRPGDVWDGRVVGGEGEDRARG